VYHYIDEEYYYLPSKPLANITDEKEVCESIQKKKHNLFCCQ